MVGSVSLLRDCARHPLEDEPVFAVRGYPGLRWYRILVTTVGEGAVDIVLAAA